MTKNWINVGRWWVGASNAPSDDDAGKSQAPPTKTSVVVGEIGLLIN